MGSCPAREWATLTRGHRRQVAAREMVSRSGRVSQRLCACTRRRRLAPYRREGLPLYSRHFAAVEPFYNGQARVENVDGSLFVIDETGEIVVKLRESCPALRME